MREFTQLNGQFLTDYNFATQSTNVESDTSNQTDDHTDYGHGTSVAGLIVAKADNNEGITGIAHDTKVIPYVINDTETYANAIRRGAKHEDIINSNIGAPVILQLSKKSGRLIYMVEKTVHQMFSVRHCYCDSRWQ